MVKLELLSDTKIPSSVEVPCIKAARDDSSNHETCFFRDQAEDRRQDEQQHTEAFTSRSEASVSDWIIDEYETVRLLGEVVAASLDNHPGMHPYCKIKSGGRLLHKTLPATNDSTWTLSTKSLFLWESTPRDLADADLEVAVWYKESNLAATARCWGSAKLEAATIVMDHCNEERWTVELNGGKGSLTLRFRLATEMDVHFLRTLYNDTRSAQKLWKELRPRAHLVTERNEAESAQSNIASAFSNIFHSPSYYDKAAGGVKFRVKPTPDPQNPKATAYMTKKQFTETTFGPSQKWVMAGSGKMGILYLEILKCNNLPNVDVGESIGNLTDCFVCAIFEDVMVQTPVIDDELSPHWMPWTQRAFCIKIMHPASLLYLGAFDFDCLSDHDPLGRVAVNLSNLQRNTDYTLTYNLYNSSQVTERTSAGDITIRVRMEYHDEKAALLAGLQPRPKFHVNVSKEKSFKVLNFTCHGEYGDQYEQKFDLTVIRSYINEILGYKNALGYCMVDTFKSLVFWRGQVRVFELNLPLHSLFFFLSCCKIVERPALMPPFFVFGIGWIFLATLTQRRQHPSPWNDCPSFMSYLEILLNLPSKPDFHEIEMNQGKEEAEAYDKAWSDRVERDQKRAADEWARQQVLSQIGNENIHTRMDGFGIPLELLERLARYQGMIARYCRYMRVIKIIATWEEGVISFWIAACFLGVGFVGLMLPWEFILTWTSRIVVYSCLGPHMMIVDAYLNDPNASDDKLIQKAMERFQKESVSARHRRQDALKLKDAKCLAFGEYATLVPSFNISRHHDRPLPCSNAVYSPGSKLDSISLSDNTVAGQQFFGVIVPRTETQTAEYEAQIEHMQQLSLAVEECVRAIKENECSDVLKRLREKTNFYDERNMPPSVGFEMVNTLDHDSVTGTNYYAPPTIELSQADRVVQKGLRRRKSRVQKNEDGVGQFGHSTLKPVGEGLPVADMDQNTGVAIFQTVDERRRSLLARTDYKSEAIVSSAIHVASSFMTDDSAIKICPTEDENDSIDNQDDTTGFETILDS